MDSKKYISYTAKKCKGYSWMYEKSARKAKMLYEASTVLSAIFTSMNFISAVTNMFVSMDIIKYIELIFTTGALFSSIFLFVWNYKSLKDDYYHYSLAFGELYSELELILFTDNISNEELKTINRDYEKKIQILLAKAPMIQSCVIAQYNMIVPDNNIYSKISFKLDDLV